MEAKTDNPFDRLSKRYDAWFESPVGRKAFAAERHALRDLLEEMPRPWLEVGLGTGRFAQALGIDAGIDSSREALKIAASRGVRARRGYAENLPFEAGTYGIILMVTTICFLSRPRRALLEARRVLRHDGRVLLGLVPRDSSWGARYVRRGQEGHPFYSAARFYTCKEVLATAATSGFVLERSTSCLLEPPAAGENVCTQVRDGIMPGAGFVGMRFKVAEPGRPVRLGSDNGARGDERTA